MDATERAATVAVASGGLRERAQALSWSGVENFSRQILALLFFFAMARYLEPSDVGVFALALAVNLVFGIIIDEPVGEALVQKTTVSREDWDTGFTVNLLIAAVCLVLSILCSGLVAWLLREPRLLYAVPVLSLATLIGALGNVHKAYLSRGLRFRSIAQTTLAAHLLGGSTGVAMAVAGFGYWAQIGSLFVVASAMTLIYWVITPWRPRLRLDLETIRSRRGYFAAYSLVRAIYLLRDQAPLVIVGLLTGVTEVGLLSLALRVVRSVGQLFEELTSRPVLSLLSREQHELDGFGGVLLQILTMIGLVAIPAFVGLAAIGQTLIPLMFGPIWAPAGAMLPWVCAVLGGWLMLHVVIVSLRARGLGAIAIRITALATALDVLVLAALVPLRLDWALIGWAARAVLSVPLALWVLRAYLGVPAWRLLRSCAVPVGASLLMVVAMAALRTVLPARPGIGFMLLLMAAGAAVYGLVTLALTPRLLRSARAVLSR